MKLSLLLVLVLICNLSFMSAYSKKSKLRYRLRHQKAQMRHRLRHRHRQVTTTTSSSSSSTTTTSSSSSSSTTSSPPPAGYPKCDSSDFADPCLDTWIPAKTFKDLLVEPEFPKDKCVIPNAPKGGAAGGAGGLKKVMKHLELRKIRISVGYAQYFFDQVDYFLLNSFEAEVKSSWKAFHANALADHKGDAAKMDGGLDMMALKKTITDSKWDKAETLDFVKLIRQYAIEDEEYGEDTTVVNLQEFVYMNIRENIQSDVEASAATNALEKTKKEISGFFDYLDCNEDGFISAENLYMGMKNMKKMQYEKTTTTMVNAFIINTMEHSSAGIDKIDMQFGMLVGMYERVITKDKMSEIVLNGMKVARRKIIEGGGGPGRRLRRLLKY